MLERWKPAPGFEWGYEVSDCGRVRGIDRALSDGRRWKGRLLTPKAGEQGHKCVCLRLPGEPKRYPLVHRLVLSAFIGPCPDGYQGAHNNGDATDNRLSNLRWDTPSGNHADKILHGTILRGEKNHLTKLSADDVKAILLERKRGAKLSDLAARYGVTAANICSIAKGKTWAHLGCDR